MSKPFFTKATFTSLFYCTLLSILTIDLNAQTLNIKDFVMFSGPTGAGTSLVGSSITINNGSIGAYKLFQTTGNATVNSNIYSGDKIIITNSNIIKGDIAAAAKTNYPNNSPITTGTILSVGSSALITGNIAVNGNIVIGGGTVNGSVTLPVGSSYIGPIPSRDTIFATPPDLFLPTMPNDTIIPTLPLNPAFGSGNITTNKTLSPGYRYGNIIYSGNKTLTLSAPGVYVINSIQWSGNSNSLTFNYPASSSGSYSIYIIGNADFGKLNATGGIASKVYLEVHGNGIGTSIPTNSFIIANGSSGGGSKWAGTVYATNGGINIGSGTGSSNLSGAFWSVSSVTVQSGVTLDYAPFISCIPPIANAGLDKPLDFSPTTTLTGSSNISGAKYNWQAVPGTGSLTPSPIDAAVTTVTVSGSYVLTVTSPTNESCFSRDTVVVFSRCTGGITEKSVIGCELKSIYDNRTTTSPFFIISNDSVMIDVIVFSGKRDSVIKILMGVTPFLDSAARYGLRDTITNDTSRYIITGKFPINHLPRLDSLAIWRPTLINYCRPYYQALNYIEYTGTNDINSPVNSSGIVTSAGDTSIRSYLVRKGYSNIGEVLNGSGIKIGVLSNSYNSITSGTQTPVKTNTADVDIVNDDLPGDTTLRIGTQLIHAINKNGFTKNVHVLKDYPGIRSDEGRAMLQIIHDVAPGAELYFYTGSLTAADFAHGILKLDTVGCNIIVDDLTYMTEPFFGNGIVAKAVETVKAHGRSYFTSAGNFGAKSYESIYRPVPAPTGFSTGKTAHNFNPGGTQDIYQSVTLAPGDYTFVLQWADNFYSNGQGTTMNDLDLYLTDSTNGTALFGFNRNNINGDPIEFLPFSITSSKTTNILIVNNTIGSNPAKVKLVVFRGNITFNEYSAGNSTVVGHALTPGSITVGATRYDKAFPFAGPLVTESFSSRGTGTKPDISGPNGVNTTVNMGSVANGGSDYDHDSYSNFFGTSAAAPHAAGMAALIMQGKKKFLGQAFTSPDEMRALMKNTATDMDIPGFDSVSGSGFINADAAMRTFAAPAPFEIRLVYPGDKIPGIDQFTLTILGQNFSPNTEIRIVYSPGDTALLATTFVSSTELTAIINPFQGNPQIIAYTLPYPLTIPGPDGKKLDGGFSNSLRFFDTTIIVQAVSFSKKYQEVMPVLDTIIKIVTPNNDTLLLQNTSLTLAQIGLDKPGLVTTDATKTSNVGTYNIVVNKLDPNNTTDAGFLKRFNYNLINGTVSIEQLPITITARDTIAYEGEQIPNVKFIYHLDGTYQIPDSASLLNSIASSHQAQLEKDGDGNDVLGLVNGKAVTIDNGVAVTIDNGVAVTIDNGQMYTEENGIRQDSIVNAQALTISSDSVVTSINEVKLDTAQIRNLSFSATVPSLQNARPNGYLTLVNGQYVSGTTQVVDITQESILDYNLNAAQTSMLSSVSNADKKGLVDIQSYSNGTAVTIDNGVAVTIDNGVAVTIDNGVAIVIDNGVAVTIDNAVEVIIKNGQTYIVTNTHDTIPYRSSQNRSAVIVDQNEIGDGLSNLKSLNVITGLTVGKQFIIPGSLVNNNYLIKYKAGILTINNSQCLLTHTPFKNFGNTTQKPTSLWLNVVTKVSGQLTAPGDYLLFKNAAATFNFISSTPSISNFPIPDGKIVAVTPRTGVTYPRTYFHFESNTWITEVPFNYASTSDIFVTGGIINSSTGFQKLNGNTNTVVVGKFYTNKTFSDQWTYAIAAYQLPQTPPTTPPTPPYEYVTYQMLGDTTDLALLKGIMSINGTYRAATPLPILNYLVQGASGGGGNNYTGSKGSFDNFTACILSGTASLTSAGSGNMLMEADGSNGSSLQQKMQLIPNPATNYITLSFVPERTGNSRVTLYTFDGRKVFETNFANTEVGVRYQRTLDVSKLVNGIYMLRLWNEGKVTNGKIIISR